MCVVSIHFPLSLLRVKQPPAAVPQTRGSVTANIGWYVPDLDKTWDAQNYVRRVLKLGRLPN